MPGLTLPTILQKDVASRNTKDSCYVTIGTKVFDITSFLDDHPGGGDLILEYGGKDVKTIMEDEISHAHSEAAYEILDDSLVGFLATDSILDSAVKSNRPDEFLPPPLTKDGLKALQASGKPVFETTGMSSAEDLTVETDLNSDYKTYKFLDLNKPLLMQLWNGGFSKEFYLQQVHRPRHYKGGESAPLFGNVLEPLTKTAWWVVPTIWLPPVVYGTYLALQGLPNPAITAAYWLFGLATWTFIEYGLHRALFHIDGYVRPRIYRVLANTRKDIFRTTESELPYTSCFTVFIITCRWTSFDWLCPPLYLSFLHFPSGNLPIQYSSITGTPLWQHTVAVYSGIFAMT